MMLSSRVETPTPEYADDEYHVMTCMQLYQSQESERGLLAAYVETGATFKVARGQRTSN